MLSLYARWDVILRGTKKPFSSFQLLLISIAGNAINSITPASRVGGEPLRAFLLKKKFGIRYGVGMASIVIEKIIDILAFLIISAFAIVYSFVFLNAPMHIVFLLVISFLSSASLLISLYYVTFHKRIRSKTVVKFLDKHKWLGDKIPILRHYRNKMMDSLTNYYSHISLIGTQKGVWRYGLLLSLAYWSFEILRAYVLFKAFGVEVPLSVIATVIIISVIIGSLPLLLPGNLGFVEGTMIVIYSSSNINSIVAGIVTMIDRFFSYWLMLIVGLPVAWYLGFTSIDEKMK